VICNYFPVPANHKGMRDLRDGTTLPCWLLKVTSSPVTRLWTVMSGAKEPTYTTNPFLETSPAKAATAGSIVRIGVPVNQFPLTVCPPENLRCRRCAIQIQGLGVE
jgi:hypothetical protein